MVGQARLTLGGESSQAPTPGLQDTLWMAGGVPEEHRNDINCRQASTRAHSST